MLRRVRMLWRCTTPTSATVALMGPSPGRGPGGPRRPRAQTEAGARGGCAESPDAVEVCAISGTGTIGPRLLESGNLQVVTTISCSAGYYAKYMIPRRVHACVADRRSLDEDGYSTCRTRRRSRNRAGSLKPPTKITVTCYSICCCCFFVDQNIEHASKDVRNSN